VNPSFPALTENQKHILAHRSSGVPRRTKHAACQKTNRAKPARPRRTPQCIFDLVFPNDSELDDRWDWRCEFLACNFRAKASGARLADDQANSARCEEVSYMRPLDAD
jgi:hypothetical protein